DGLAEDQALGDLAAEVHLAARDVGRKRHVRPIGARVDGGVPVVAEVEPHPALRSRTGTARISMGSATVGYFRAMATMISMSSARASTAMVADCRVTIRATSMASSSLV